MKKWFIVLAGILSLVNFAKAQNLNLYEKRIFIQNNDTLPYRILLPLNFDANKKYPLVLFLHGAGERGNDNEKQLTHGSKIFLADSNRTGYPAIVVFPQCASKSFWSNIGYHVDTVTKKRVIEFKEEGEPTQAMKLLMGLYRDLGKNYLLDGNRLYAGGLSMGGMGTFELVRRIPNAFAAAFAICGGANTATANKINNTAWWIFHGLKDNVVDPQFSKDMAKALKKEGAEVKLTLYSGDGHNSWDNAFKEPEFFSWMFSQHK